MGRREFVAGMAMLMSLVALSIDSMLPALSDIGASLGVVNPNHPQLIISILFLGMAFGLVFYGPLSDSFGRKPAIYLGGAIFICGCFISILAQGFVMMLVGRFLQGFGAASTRVVSIALIRDKFEGREMAQVMSLIMIIFIMVPALAPSLGQVVLMVAEWRAVFGLLLTLAVVSLFWLKVRMPETLPLEKRKSFSVLVIKSGVLETLRTPVSMGYTLASGLIFASFIGYLSTAQQVLAIQYKTGDRFAVYFGALALAIGVSSYANSKVVVRFGMERLCMASLKIMSLVAGVFFLFTLYHSGEPPFVAFISYLTIIFFCSGVLFGNFNALALTPLGHIAGVGNSVVSSIQTFISVSIGASIAYLYNGTITPMTAGFFVTSVGSLVVTHLTIRITPPAPSSLVARS